MISRRTFLTSGGLATSGVLGLTSLFSNHESHAGFVCPPCGCDKDDHVFSAPGLCTACGMVLGPHNEAKLGLNPAKLPMGAGQFEWFNPAKQRGSSKESRASNNGASVIVSYYYPENFSSNSEVVLVLPGAGRNQDTYRNCWLQNSVANGSLIVSLGYPEQDYDFAAYHMGGLVKNLSFSASDIIKKHKGRVIHANDQDINLELNRESSSWLFTDFDALFDYVMDTIGASQSTYTLFGHSAGAQIIHRLALFDSNVDSDRNYKAARLIAANAGFYTFPDASKPMPTGYRGFGFSDEHLKSVFARRLSILLGELDNHPFAGGTFLRTPIVDLQGAGRLQRGKHFYDFSAQRAKELGVPFNWTLEVVPNVGHEAYKMSQAASRLL